MSIIKLQISARFELEISWARNEIPQQTRTECQLSKTSSPTRLGIWLFIHCQIRHIPLRKCKHELINKATI